MIYSPSWYKVLFVFFLVFLFLLITGLTGIVSAMAIYKVNYISIIAAIDNPDLTNIHINKFLQLIQTIGIFIIPALIASFFLDSSVTGYLKLDRKPSFVSILLIVFSMITWIPVINFIANLNAQLNLPDTFNFLEEKLVRLRDNYNQLTGLFLDSSLPGDFLINIFMMALLPSIGEELLFRGIFQRLFAEWSKSVHWGIMLSSLLFSFFHFEFYGFLPRFLLGAFFGYLFAWTASIWIPILGHFMNNMVIVSYYYFVQPANDHSRLDELGTKADIYFFLSLTGGIVLSGLLFYHEKSRQIHIR